MTEFYYDREQSQAKHEILRRYLVPFSNKILSSWPSLDFIDCFSGPWKNVDSENLTDTSIGIALRTLSEVAEKRGHTSSNRCIRCIFNEANGASFRKLKAFADRASDSFPLVKVEILHGEFEKNAARIKQLADHSFQLLFVDPTGYTGFPPEALRIFKGRSGEIIVNFMRSFIERFVSGNHSERAKALVSLLGQSRADDLLKGSFSIETLENAYLDMLRRDLGYKYAGFSPIHNPDKNEIHFNLAYGTHHVDGMEVMRSSEYKALSEHDRACFTKTLEKHGGDLFSTSGLINDMQILGPYLRARKEHRERAASVLLEIITRSANGIKFCNLAAEAQQQLFLKRTELGDVILEMNAKRLVDNTWQLRKGRRPGADDSIIQTRS